ncbi:hypothetical protein DEO72_LG11g1836 [Vigna unguiculata]|uniref:Uncharacterized protein n=1 Tax=Vigna unguiculata TaxID=3917 RepID=A0A4D6NLY3_VIGUN|nr:hypothetical protein DEO72_LG11g1836 [Vigna unguiculata]
MRDVMDDGVCQNQSSKFVGGGCCSGSWCATNLLVLRDGAEGCCLRAFLVLALSTVQIWLQWWNQWLLWWCGAAAYAKKMEMFLRQGGVAVAMTICGGYRRGGGCCSGSWCATNLLVLRDGAEGCCLRAFLVLALSTVQIWLQWCFSNDVAAANLVCEEDGDVFASRWSCGGYDHLRRLPARFRCVERKWCCEQVQGRRALVRAFMVARWCSRWSETLLPARMATRLAAAVAMVMEGDDEN